MKVYQRILSLALCIMLIVTFVTPSMLVSAEEEKQTGELGFLGETTGSKTGLTYKDKFTEDWEGGLDLNKWSVELLQDDFKSDFQVVVDPKGGTNADGTPNQVMHYNYMQTWLVPTDDYWPVDGMQAGEMAQIKMRVLMEDFWLEFSNVTNNNDPGMVWSYISPNKQMGFQFASKAKEYELMQGLVVGHNLWNDMYIGGNIYKSQFPQGYYGQGFVTDEWFNVTITINGGKVTFSAEDKNGVVATSKTEAVAFSDGKFAIGNYRINRNQKNYKRTNGVMYIDDIEVSFIQSTVDKDDVQEKVTAYYAGNTFLEPGDTLNITGEDLGVTVASAQIKKIDLDKTAGTTSAKYVNETTYDKAQVANVAWEDIPYETGSLITDFTIQQRSEAGLKMILPDGSVKGQEMYAERGSYAVLLKAATGKAEDDAVIIVNNPQISLLLPNDGDAATPNGWIKLSGYNLSVQNDLSKVSAILIDNKGNRRLIDNSKIEVDTTENNGESNDYYMMIHLNGLAAGDYQVMVHNGYGGDYGWSMPFDFTVKAKAENQKWRDMGVFNVQDYGAVGDSTTNDTAAIQSAINAAVENGGGMVYFPRLKNGESAGYRITTPLRVKENISLVGDGDDMSFIFYSGYLDTERQEYFIRFDRNIEIADLQLACQTNPFNYAIRRNENGTTEPGNVYLNDAHILIDTTGSISDSVGVVMEGYTHATAYTYLTELWTGVHQYFCYLMDVRENYFTIKDSIVYIQPRLSNKAAHLFVNSDYFYFTGYNDGEGVNTWCGYSCFKAGFFENGSFGKMTGNMHYRNIVNRDDTNNNRELFFNDGGVKGTNIKMQPLLENYSDDEYRTIMEEELSTLSTETEKNALIAQVKTFVEQHPGQVYRFLNYTPIARNMFGWLYVVSGQGAGQMRELSNITKIGKYTYITVEEPFAITPNRSSLVAHGRDTYFKTIVNNAEFTNGTKVGPYGHFVDLVFDKITMDKANSGVSFISAYDGFMWYCSAKNVSATSIRVMRTDELYDGAAAGTSNKSTLNAIQFLGIRYADSFMGENGFMQVDRAGGKLAIGVSDIVYEHIDILNPEPTVIFGAINAMQGVWLRDVKQHTQKDDADGYSEISPYTMDSLSKIRSKANDSVYGTPRIWCEGVDVKAKRQRGDINNDGMITLKDVTLLRQLLGEEKSAEELDTAYGKTTSTTYADMSDDGAVDARDIYAIRNYVRTGTVGDVGSSGSGGSGTGGGESGGEEKPDEPDTPIVPENPDVIVKEDNVIIDFSKEEDED